MTTTTHDIDTATATAAPAITDLQGLTNAVARLASLQLILNNAEGNMQAQVEALKKAFADATAEHAAEIKTTFAQVEAYCAANKETLFPLKNGKRKKTFAVLQHALQYRSSQSVNAPNDAAEQIAALVRTLEARLISEQAKGDARDVDAIKEVAAVITTLNGLLRPSAPELNKDAVKLVTNEQASGLLLAMGVGVISSETFKLAFTFTPEQTQAA